MLVWLYTLPIWVVIISIESAIVFWTVGESLIINVFKSNSANKNQKIWKIFNLTVFVFSVLFIIYVTLITRSDVIRSLHPEPFRLFRLAKQNPEIYRSMLMNVLLFLPFGLSLSSLSPKSKTVFTVFISLTAGILISCFIETAQYIFMIGQTEFDDIICNAFGSLLGCTPILIRRIYTKCYNK